MKRNTKQEDRSGFVVMASLIGLVKPLMSYMVLAICMGVVGHLFAAFITIFGGYAVLVTLQQEITLPFGAHLSLAGIFICLGIFAVARGFLRYAEQACNHFIAFKLLALIRDKVFSALRRLCPAKLEGKDKGNLISVITSDIELLEVFYAHTISPICIACVFSCIMVVFIGSFHIALGVLSAVAYITVGAVIPLVTARLSGNEGLKLRRKSGELSSFVLDSLRGLSETIQYGQGDARLSEMNRMTDTLARDQERMKRIAGRNGALTNSIILLFDLGMLALSASLCSFDGCLIATLALMSSFGPVVALAALGATLQSTLAAGNRVLAILDEKPVVEEIEGKASEKFRGAAAERVTFAYGKETILDGLSVEVPSNKIVGIVGKSGSGKSTLLKLFMRFWEVQEGRIQISGKSVNEINTSNLRDMESFVTQETYLFHDSIRNNVRLAKLDATDDEIIAACKKASVHDFIMSLPAGYDTSVGELGDTLSGGERQRLGLARAFLHNAPFVLLDEPTSNLDSLNEAVILKALHEERSGKTVVLVSHRASTMGIADEVYSVEHGRTS
ncbi:ABC transporter ATP-binding protein [Lancefieldella rimae]|uniref:amino acid ABC transporter ATP-binding/permease protein n=1 Tax=Lancefieldella rimae TaxID=1383 RepID=UPI00288B7B8A|nr:ABC transporter ATP-binding protein [Lancefieldella rimae]